MTEYSEQFVRGLRDNIYGLQTENNWNACKEHWMRPTEIQWLIEHQPR